MGYFLLDDEKMTKVQTLIQERNRRSLINQWSRVFRFVVGDIVTATYWKGSIIYQFEGICICIRKKRLLRPTAVILLRNVLAGVGVECTFLYFYQRVFYLQISDYKRKQFSYKRAKLYYLRRRLNRASCVK